MGCYDFCGHYEWSFDWLERQGGHALVKAYWNEAIKEDSQRHAVELITRDGFAGMANYWGHTLLEESPERGFTITQLADVFRVDMHDCPSKGFLLRNGIEAYRDYCDHCIGWIGPLMKGAGFVIDHEHNHQAQCWWEFRKRDDPKQASAPGAVAGQHDVRLRADWQSASARLDHYRKATDSDNKQPGRGQE